MDKKEILKEFGRNLKAERNRAGLSQEQLAERIRGILWTSGRYN